MNIDEAIQLFEQNNAISIKDFNSNRLQCLKNKQFLDQYIGEDIFEKNIECWLDNFKEKDVFLKLLPNYIYVPEMIYGIQLDAILSRIEEKCNMGHKILEETYFITFPSKRGIKSGGDIIRALLPIGNLDCVKKEQLIVEVEKNKDSISKAKCIVLIDDVIGSGKTAKENICNFFKMDDIDLTGKKLFLVAMYAEETVKRELEKEFNGFEHELEVIVLYECKKCLSENYIFSKAEMEVSKSIIIRAEEEVAGKKVGEKKSYALGFENSQLLLSFFYNTPNNTLCIFWKPTKINFPLFTRSSFRRPSIEEIKLNRAIKRKNAYEMAKIDRTERQ